MTGLSRAVVVTMAVLAALTVGLTAQVPVSRPRITGIDHIVFRASDAAAARRFYGDLLGLLGSVGGIVAGCPPGDPCDGSTTQKVGPRLQFEVGQRQMIYVEPDLPAGEEERLRLLAFSTPDVEALAAHLTAKGIAVTRILAPAQRGPVPLSGRPSAIGVSDPDGHPIAFVQRDWPPQDRIPGPGASRVKVPLSTRILHAGLTVRDEAAANRFYKDVLGFSEIWRGGRSEGTTDWINMRVPDGTDYLEYMLVSSAPDRRQRGVLHHVALLVPDIQAAWQAAGARTPAEKRATLGPPNVGRNGRWQLNLYDGDGTRTELMEPFTVR
jgi:catechol 2,3-dioxygenase-like lactoylglutathione lyase family enzyme